MSTQSQDRITNPATTLSDMIVALSEGNPGAVRVLMEWTHSDPMAPIAMLILDTKRLYGSRIWELYKLCDQDIERFKYHAQVELPNQETGELSVTGPYSPSFDDAEFWKKHKFGKPNSFWALEDPPSNPNYEFPIR